MYGSVFLGQIWPLEFLQRSGGCWMDSGTFYTAFVGHVFDILICVIPLVTYD